ncbi:MAG: recombination-associated protein RdgC [Rudaea sp.]|uniref:recombination-associated protein RdgC n=1 Tax=unclassified Rudaea TaxID=2627037 RepID=UPI0010F78CE2|nr:MULTISPECIES: recombination-associated protein RdgC [unclassified Rudaea]MBN8885401.1 recombination-associated protein RdgC [Rudaea sp.]MBR0346773.1 recombination-associated protein RdgC [Rudaea sp.]
MWFRNLTLFRFSPAVAKSLKSLEDDLVEKKLRPCGPIELATRGFVSPFGRNEEALVHRTGEFALVTLGGEDKLLPSSVINDELAARLQKIAEKTGRKPGGKERKRLKEEVLTDLLPRAFIRLSKRSAYLDSKEGWFVVDTASKKAAEEAVTQLREALGSFPALPMAAEESPRVLMTDWLAGGKLPAGLALGDECELRDPVESGAIVRCRRQELETDEVREHLKSGKQVFALGLTFEDRLSFSLGEDLVVRKLRFLDVIQDELGEGDKESAAAELDAVFALMSLELRRLFAKFEEWFGLPRPTDKK